MAVGRGRRPGEWEAGGAAFAGAAILALALATWAAVGAFGARQGRAAAGAELQRARARGYVVVAVPLWAPPFGAPSRDGGWAGLDVALARGIAGGALGNPERVHLLPVTPGQRIWAARSGAADAVAAAYAAPGRTPPPLPPGIDAVGPYHTEPVALLVRRGRPVASWRQLDGTVVGLLPGAAGGERLRALAAAGPGAAARPVVEESLNAGQAAADLATGRLRAVLGGLSECGALAVHDPELRVQAAAGLGEQSYWVLVPAGDSGMRAAVRRAIDGLPRGPALRGALRLWAAAAAPPPLPAPEPAPGPAPLLTAPSAAA